LYRRSGSSLNASGDSCDGHLPLQCVAATLPAYRPTPKRHGAPCRPHPGANTTSMPGPRESGPIRLRVPAMLETRPASDGFTVYDTDAGEPIITFPSRAEADELVAALQIEDVHAQLARWSQNANPVTEGVSNGSDSSTKIKEFPRM